MPESMATVKAAGVTAIIHRATIGLRTDSGYAARRTAAMAQGLLWGAYCFLTHDDPIAQADHFLSVVQPDARTLIAVDVERNTDNTIPTLAQVEAFVLRIHEQTGRWPVLYTGYFVLKDDLGWTGQSVITNCPLWIAAYGNSPEIPDGWSSYALWQYTDGSIGSEPRRFSGLSNAYDRSEFKGTADDLAKWWAS